jgi:DNA-directed RNA polymerase subunit K/omega
MLSHNLTFEKIMDKLGNKYEALVRMSIIAKRLADGEGPVPVAQNEKVTLVAMDQYLKQYALDNPTDSAPAADSK